MSILIKDGKELITKLQKLNKITSTLEEEKRSLKSMLEKAQIDFKNSKKEYNLKLKQKDEKIQQLNFFLSERDNINKSTTKDRELITKNRELIFQINKLRRDIEIFKKRDNVLTTRKKRGSFMPKSSSSRFSFQNINDFQSIFKDLKQHKKGIEKDLKNKSKSRISKNLKSLIKEKDLNENDLLKIVSNEIEENTKKTKRASLYMIQKIQTILNEVYEDNKKLNIINENLKSDKELLNINFDKIKDELRNLNIIYDESLLKYDVLEEDKNICCEEIIDLKQKIKKIYFEHKIDVNKIYEERDNKEKDFYFKIEFLEKENLHLEKSVKNLLFEKKNIEVFEKDLKKDLNECRLKYTIISKSHEKIKENFEKLKKEKNDLEINFTQTKQELIKLQEISLIKEERKKVQNSNKIKELNGTINNLRGRIESINIETRKSIHPNLEILELGEEFENENIYDENFIEDNFLIGIDEVDSSREMEKVLDNSLSQGPSFNNSIEENNEILKENSLNKNDEAIKIDFCNILNSELDLDLKKIVDNFLENEKMQIFDELFQKDFVKYKNSNYENKDFDNNQNLDTTLEFKEIENSKIENNLLIEDLKKEIDFLKKEILDLNKKIDVINKQNIDLDFQRSNIQRKNDFSDNEINLLKKTNIKNQEIISNLKIDLEKKNDIINLENEKNLLNLKKIEDLIEKNDILIKKELLEKNNAEELKKKNDLIIKKLKIEIFDLKSVDEKKEKKEVEDKNYIKEFLTELEKKNNEIFKIRNTNLNLKEKINVKQKINQKLEEDIKKLYLEMDHLEEKNNLEKQKLKEEIKFYEKEKYDLEEKLVEIRIFSNNEKNFNDEKFFRYNKLIKALNHKVKIYEKAIEEYNNQSSDDESD